MNGASLNNLPCPIPYQGSKRKLAGQILDLSIAPVSQLLIEPFAGSAALSLGAATLGLAKRFLLAEILKPLAGIWSMILESPEQLAAEYEGLWESDLETAKATFYEVRDLFNKDQEPSKLLYLIARCVKNSIRFNSDGQFNQSADNRRRGMHPSRMRREILAAHSLLKDSAQVLATDYREALAGASRSDLVYMDPPYQGVSTNRDSRYFQSLDLEGFVQELDRLNRVGIDFLISFDGTCGPKSYGQELPKELNLTRVLLNAGRSSQATLLGRNYETTESLYLSASLTQKLRSRLGTTRMHEQLTFV